MFHIKSHVAETQNSIIMCFTQKKRRCAGAELSLKKLMTIFTIEKKHHFFLTGEKQNRQNKSKAKKKQKAA